MHMFSDTDKIHLETKIDEMLSFYFVMLVNGSYKNLFAIYELVSIGLVSYWV